jgi:hypothetical protein
MIQEENEEYHTLGDGTSLSRHHFRKVLKPNKSKKKLNKPTKSPE